MTATGSRIWALPDDLGATDDPVLPTHEGPMSP